MIYLDSCALVKLVARHRRPPPWSTTCAGTPSSGTSPAPWCAPRCAGRCAASRPPAKQLATADKLLGAVITISIRDELLDAAGALPEAGLRSLDAIHLATAQSLGPAMTAFVTYDTPAAHAVDRANLPTAAPR